MHFHLSLLTAALEQSSYFQSINAIDKRSRLEAQ